MGMEAMDGQEVQAQAMEGGEESVAAATPSVQAEASKVQEGTAAGLGDGQPVTEKGEDGQNGQTAPPAGQPVLSKTALKKLEKGRRRQEHAALKKQEKKEQKHQEKEKVKSERQARITELPEDERSELRSKQMALREERRQRHQSAREKLVKDVKEGQRIVLDLEFTELMTPNEISSLGQQVMYCYSANVRAPTPCRLTLSGCSGVMKERMDKISGFANWIIEAEERPYMEVFAEQTEKLVYLTADSPNTIETLDKDKIYIIGGIVDRNRHKNVTLDKAVKQGIATAKLPIGQYLKLLSSQVLTVNQVMEALLNHMGGDAWDVALDKAVPKRKRDEGKPKEDAKGQEEKGGEKPGDASLDHGLSDEEMKTKRPKLDEDEVLDAPLEQDNA